MPEIKTGQMPRGIPFIIGNEAAERFSYYGMRSILVVFMTKYMLDRSGQLDTMSPEEAKSAFHTFVMAVYFLPFLGAILADAFLGKYKTIIILSIVYCLGHFTLAIDSTRMGLLIGLGLIALGAGGIKPCVSATVGDQFNPSNQHLISRVYAWFYFSINLGSAFSTWWIPKLLEKQGPHVAFAVPGIFMFIATIIFWMGRKRFVHVPPGGMAFVKDVFGPVGRQTILKMASIYIFIAVFWSLWEQTASAWVLQAEKMDLHFVTDWLPSQIQTANPILTLLFIPLCSYVIYPAISKVFPLTPLRKIGIGLFLAVPSFIIPTWVESQIASGLRPNIGWHFLAYVLLTAAEVMISVTALEFAYTQAPNRMKSLIMSITYLGSISLGNGFTALFNKLIQNPDKTSKLTGVQYYVFFDVLMLLTAIVFIFVALRYKEQTYIQEQPAPAPAAS